MDAKEVNPISPTLPVSMPDLETLFPKPDPESHSPELDPDKQDEAPLGTKDAPTKPEAGDASTDDHVDQTQLDPCQYNMGHKARGVFVLFNVVNFKTKTKEAEKQMKRDGSDMDAVRLEETFKGMNFAVIRFNDPLASDMVGILKEGK